MARKQEEEQVSETVEDFQKAWDEEVAATDGEGGDDAEEADEEEDDGGEAAAVEELGKGAGEEESEGDGETEEGDEEESEEEEDDGDEEEESTSEDGLPPAVAKMKSELEKHGFTFDGRQVVPQERKHFREKIRRKYAEIEQEKHAAVQELERTGSNLEQKFSKYAEMREALSSGSPEAMDKFAALIAEESGLDEVKSWLDLNKQHFTRLQSPLYKETVRLKRQQEEDRRERQRLEAERESLLAAEKQKQARQSWKDDIIDQLETIEDDVVKSFAGDDLFVEQVIQIQENEYRRTGNVPSAEEAAGLAISGARAMHQKLSKIFGTQGAAAPESRDGVANAGEPSRGPNSGKKNGRKPKKSISQRKAAEASGKLGDYIPDDEFFKMGVEALREATS